MKLNKILLILLMLIFLSSFITATGICSLNKNQYHPGENSVFTCSCSSPIEENKLGYLVWRNSTGFILYSEIINSGNCRSSDFGTQHIFSYGQTNFTGNVTFSLNSDGTGTPINWDDLSDINYDDFNLLGSHSTDCIIKPFIINASSIGLPVANLGYWGSLEIQVFDALTNYTLTHSVCSLNVYDSSTGDLEFQEPLRTYNKDHIETGAFGLGYFEHEFIESELLPNHLYLAKIYCYCINNSDETCYYGDGGLGQAAEFKECQADFLFTTGEDLRTADSRIYYVVISTIILFIIILIYVGRKIENEQIRGLLTYIGFGCIPLCLQVSKTILELNNGNPRLISLVWTFEWVSMILFVFLLMYLFIMFLKSILESYNVKGQE